MDQLLFRQGDVLLRRVESIPDGLTLVLRHGERIVLAYGERTGHAHVIEAPSEEALLLGAEEERRFLRLIAPVELRHEEHATLTIPRRDYEVLRQREWTDADEDEQRWRWAGD